MRILNYSTINLTYNCIRNKRKNRENQYVINKNCCEWTHWRPWRISHNCKILGTYFYVVFYLVLSVELGDSAGSNWSFKVLDLLDTMSICWCNKRNNFRKMALFLIKMKDMFSFLKLSFWLILFIISSANINWRVNHFFLVLTCCLFKNVSVNFIVDFCRFLHRY